MSIWEAIGLAAAIAIGLALVSGFFSASETALTGASRARMFQLEKDGDVAAIRVNKLLDGDPSARELLRQGIAEGMPR